MRFSDYRDGLIRRADELDAMGLTKEADELDKLIAEASLASPMILALKKDDANEANRVLFEIVKNTPRGSTPAKELGLTDSDFKEFANAVKTHDMDAARSVLGVGKDSTNPAMPSCVNCGVDDAPLDEHGLCPECYEANKGSFEDENLERVLDEHNKDREAIQEHRENQ